jgi:uncharacterized caspase-like protein
MRFPLLTCLLAAVVALASLFSSAPVRGQAPPKPAGERYALLVGVQQYGKGELRNLRYAQHDIEELSAVLLKAGYRKENVVRMTQQEGATDTDLLPTADNIRQQLRLLLDDRKPDHSVLVALAGHGIQFQGDTENYFCPAGAKLDDKRTLLPLGEVYKALEKSPAGFKLLLVDACRNDPLSASAARRATVDVPSVTRPRKPVSPGGVAALFSCSEGELAFEHESLQHGVFFHFVIQGLQGEADLNHDLQVTMAELMEFVQLRVADFVRAEFKKRQMPELVGKLRSSVPLIVLPEAPTRKELGLREAVLILEMAINWDAVAESWRTRREGWVHDVVDAGSVHDLAEQVIDLESHVTWEAVSERWRERRAGWVEECHAAKSAKALQELLIELETVILWDAVSEKWRALREPWLKAVRESGKL